MCIRDSSLSEYKNQFILKGGMLVAAMVGLDARATMDLDATIKGTNVSVDVYKKQIRCAILQCQMQKRAKVSGQPAE